MQFCFESAQKFEIKSIKRKMKVRNLNGEKLRINLKESFPAGQTQRLVLSLINLQRRKDALCQNLF